MDENKRRKSSRWRTYLCISVVLHLGYLSPLHCIRTCCSKEEEGTRRAGKLKLQVWISNEISIRMQVEAKTIEFCSRAEKTTQLCMRLGQQDEMRMRCICLFVGQEDEMRCFLNVNDNVSGCLIRLAFLILWHFWDYVEVHILFIWWCLCTSPDFKMVEHSISQINNILPILYL